MIVVGRIFYVCVYIAVAAMQSIGECIDGSRTAMYKSYTAVVARVNERQESRPFRLRTLSEGNIAGHPPARSKTQWKCL